ncbi:MAG: hypothetical protein ABSE72_11625 [Bacteroidales bacterium]|jgi:hypothetical protein
MKTSKNLLQADKSSNEETPIKAGAGKLLKSILVIFMLLLITLLSSCIVPGPGHGSRGGGHERHSHNERHSHDEHHD